MELHLNEKLLDSIQTVRAQHKHGRGGLNNNIVKATPISWKWDELKENTGESPLQLLLTTSIMNKE